MDKIKVTCSGHPKSGKVYAGEQDISRFISRVEIVLDVKEGVTAVLTCPFPDVEVEGDLQEFIARNNLVEDGLTDVSAFGDTVRRFKKAATDA